MEPLWITLVRKHAIDEINASIHSSIYKDQLPFSSLTRNLTASDAKRTVLSNLKVTFENNENIDLKKAIQNSKKENLAVCNTHNVSVSDTEACITQIEALLLYAEDLSNQFSLNHLSTEDCKQSIGMSLVLSLFDYLLIKQLITLKGVKHNATITAKKENATHDLLSQLASLEQKYQDNKDIFYYLALSGHLSNVQSIVSGLVDPAYQLTNLLHINYYGFDISASIDTLVKGGQLDTIIQANTQKVNNKIKELQAQNTDSEPTNFSGIKSQVATITEKGLGGFTAAQVEPKKEETKQESTPIATGKKGKNKR